MRKDIKEGPIIYGQRIDKIKEIINQNNSQEILEKILDLMDRCYDDFYWEKEMYIKERNTLNSPFNKSHCEQCIQSQRDKMVSFDLLLLRIERFINKKEK